MISASLNQYRITASIGAGGMGEVFRARDTRLNRDVAMKGCEWPFGDHAFARAASGLPHCCHHTAKDADYRLRSFR